jgi:tritrans,polycis-undecaprenyl-diphosphate synthase [geranylgeranyl-diphosphate specific]
LELSVKNAEQPLKAIFMLKSIAITPDGNRRYAEKEDLELIEAYTMGFNKAEEVFDWCLGTEGLKTATIYALSTENLIRNRDELTVLFKLYDHYFRKLAEHPKIHDNRVHVRIIGQAEQLDGLGPAIRELESATAEYDNYNLNIALAYGGRSEILNAIRRAGEAGELATLDEATMSKYLYQPQDINLMIRTGGRHRLSNFLTWQSAYTELYFTDKLWPEFSREDFDAAIEFYNQTKRNFGR